jgi:hypothetical protein
MTERDPQRAIQLKLARSEAKPVKRIPTGFSALDQSPPARLRSPSAAAHTQQNSLRAAPGQAQSIS